MSAAKRAYEDDELKERTRREYERMEDKVERLTAKLKAERVKYERLMKATWKFIGAYNCTTELSELGSTIHELVSAYVELTENKSGIHKA